MTITNDPAGRRFTSTDVNGVTTYSDYDGNQLIGQQIGTGTGSTYADIFDGIGVGLGGTLQYTTSGPDGFNDALYLPNGMRQALDQSQRDGFGHRQEVPTGAPEVMGFDGSIGNGLRYNPGTGGYIDPNGDEQDDGIGAYRNALGNFWGGVNKLNGLGKAGLMMAANANLLYNLNTALTGKNPDGKKANKLDRGLALLSFVPGEWLANGLGKLGGALGKLRGKLFPPPAIRDPLSLAELMREAKYLPTNEVGVSGPKVRLFADSIKSKTWEFPTGENAVMVIDGNGAALLEGHHHYVAYHLLHGEEPPAAFFRQVNVVRPSKQWYQLIVDPKMWPISP